MALFNTKTPAYRPGKQLELNWKTFRKGLNNLLAANEIDKEEMAVAKNVVLKGAGIPTKRWGSNAYFSASTVTSDKVRGLKGYYKASGTNELLALTDTGYLTKKNSSTFTIISGVSWPSTSDVQMAQLSDKMYIVDGMRELARYDGTTLAGFPTLAIPSGVGASQLSGASGTNTYSYRLSTVSKVGETLASNSVTLDNQPQSLTDGTIRVAWTAVSAASGDLSGYNIYGRDEGNERFLGFVADVPGGASSTVFLDDGTAIPQEFTFPPTADSTGGPVSPFLIRHQDRLVFAKLSGEPSKILISGREPNQEKFDLAYGGNYLKIEADAGDNISGLKSFRDRIIVFKERSIWQVRLSTIQIGNFYVTIPTAELITSSHGCIAPKSIVSVENDIFFLTRKGVYSLGYESGFAFDVLRTNEISVKIRTFMEQRSQAELESAIATYKDFKYILGFPSIEKMMVFDRERLAWTGPWKLDGHIFEIYYDSDRIERLLLGHEAGPTIDEVSKDFDTDNGTKIQVEMRTKQDDFKDWSSFKNIKNVFTRFKNVKGTVNFDIRLEKRDGSVLTNKSFNVASTAGNTGFGADMFGDLEWGDSAGTFLGVDPSEIIKWARINEAARTVQYVVTTSDGNFELLGIKTEASSIGSGFRPTSWVT